MWINALCAKAGNQGGRVSHWDWKDWLTITAWALLAIWLAGGLIGKVHIRVNWGWFWLWVAFNWCGWYGLITLAALQKLYHCLPRGPTWLWGRRRDRAALMLHSIQPLGKPFIEVTHD